MNGAGCMHDVIMTAVRLNQVPVKENETSWINCSFLQGGRTAMPSKAPLFLRPPRYPDTRPHLHVDAAQQHNPNIITVSRLCFVLSFGFNVLLPVNKSLSSRTQISVVPGTRTISSKLCKVQPTCGTNYRKITD